MIVCLCYGCCVIRCCCADPEYFIPTCRSSSRCCWGLRTSFQAWLLRGCALARWWGAAAFARSCGHCVAYGYAYFVWNALFVFCLGCLSLRACSCYLVVLKLVVCRVLDLELWFDRSMDCVAALRYVQNGNTHITNKFVKKDIIFALPPKLNKL